MKVTLYFKQIPTAEEYELSNSKVCIIIVIFSVKWMLQTDIF